MTQPRPAHRAGRGGTARRQPPRWIPILIALVTVLLVGAAWAVVACAPKATAPRHQPPTGAAKGGFAPSVVASALAGSSTTATEQARPATPSGSAVAVPASSASPEVRATRVPVLLYHHVSPDANNFIAMTPAQFEKQMSWLADNGYHPISQQQMVDFLYEARPLPPRPVMITFDDGRLNQLQYAVPILRRHGFTATFFVTKKWVVGGGAFMNAGQIRKLADEGFDIGSHSLTHMPLQNRGSESRESHEKRVHDQVYGSKAYVEEITGKPCLAMAYPAGYYGNKTWLPSILRAAGYKLGYTVDGGVVRFGDRPFLLKRNDTGRGAFEAFKGYVTRD